MNSRAGEETFVDNPNRQTFPHSFQGRTHSLVAYENNNKSEENERNSISSVCAIHLSQSPPLPAILRESITKIEPINPSSI